MATAGPAFVTQIEPFPDVMLAGRPPLGRSVCVTTEPEEFREATAFASSAIADPPPWRPANRPAPAATTAASQPAVRQRRSFCRQVELEADLHHTHRLGHALECDSPAVDVHQLVDAAGEVHDALADQHLAGGGLRAETGGKVERTTAIPAFDGDGLACVDADAKAQWQPWIGTDLVCTALLQRDGGTDGPARRAEGAHRLVAAQLEDGSAVRFDLLAHHLREPRCQPARRLVPLGLCEGRVPADVRDQEGANGGLLGALVTHGWASVRLGLLSCCHVRRTGVTG
jgi:hypothetical protein